MMQNDFYGAAAPNAFAFSFEEKEQIKDALINLGLDENSQQNFMDYVEKTGMLTTFGYGSLLSYSHLESSAPENGPRKWKPSLKEKFPSIDTERLYSIQKAALYGYEKDFVCRDIFYRGTPESPGITMGLCDSSEAVAEGGILQTNLKDIGISRDEVVSFIGYYLEQFKDREFPSNISIYKFAFKFLETSEEKIQPGLTCIADTHSHLYAGHLPFADRAEILATNMGPAIKDGKARPAGAVTNLDYLRNTIDGMISKGLPVDDRLIKYYALAVDMRNNCDPALRAKLESFEVPKRHAATLEFLSQKGISTTWAFAEGATSIVER
jgi:cation transport regulator ChaC